MDGIHNIVKIFFLTGRWVIRYGIYRNWWSLLTSVDRWYRCVSRKNQFDRKETGRYALQSVEKVHFIAKTFAFRVAIGS